LGLTTQDSEVGVILGPTSTPMFTEFGDSSVSRGDTSLIIEAPDPTLNHALR